MTINLISCEPGFIRTEDQNNCTDANECFAEPCYNGGTCVNRDKGQGFYCHCPEGYDGDVCNALRRESVMRFSTQSLTIIVVCLLITIRKQTNYIAAITTIPFENLSSCGKKLYNYHRQ